MNENEKRLNEVALELAISRARRIVLMRILDTTPNTSDFSLSNKQAALSVLTMGLAIEAEYQQKINCWVIKEGNPSALTERFNLKEKHVVRFLRGLEDHKFIAFRVHLDVIEVYFDRLRFPHEILTEGELLQKGKRSAEKLIRNTKRLARESGLSSQFTDDEIETRVRGLGK